MRIVPPHLHGRTQHKTLQARLAEDILIRRQRSQFVRTQPGRFLLRSLLTDPNVPEEYKSEFPAPRRAEQLQNFLVLCWRNLRPPESDTFVLLEGKQEEAFLASLRLEYRLLSEVSDRSDFSFFKTVTVIVRDRFFLMSRSYSRSGNDLSGPKSAGLFAYVTVDDRNLFSSDPYGFAEAAKRSLAEQAHMTDDLLRDLDKRRLRHVGLVNGGPASCTATVVFVYVCHPKFDPVERHPYSRNFFWQDVDQRLNRSDDFDQCSELLINSGFLRSLNYDATREAI
jgi:hypothetical protein